MRSVMPRSGCDVWEWEWNGTERTATINSHLLPLATTYAAAVPTQAQDRDHVPPVLWVVVLVLLAAYALPPAAANLPSAELRVCVVLRGVVDAVPTHMGDHCQRPPAARL